MAYAFDTLGYAQRLRTAGVSQEQAEAHAEAARDFIMGELVTRSDLQSEIRAVRTDLRSEIQAVRSDLHSEIQTVRSDLQSEIWAVKSELQAAIDGLSLRLTLRLGVMLATGIGILAALIKL